MEITQTFSLFCMAFTFWTILCYSHIMRRHLAAAEAVRVIGTLQAGQTQRSGWTVLCVADCQDLESL